MAILCLILSQHSFLGMGIVIKKKSLITLDLQSRAHFQIGLKIIFAIPAAQFSLKFSHKHNLPSSKFQPTKKDIYMCLCVLEEKIRIICIMKTHSIVFNINYVEEKKSATLIYLFGMLIISSWKQSRLRSSRRCFGLLRKSWKRYSFNRASTVQRICTVNVVKETQQDLEMSPVCVSAGFANICLPTICLPSCQLLLSSLKS